MAHRLALFQHRLVRLIVPAAPDRVFQPANIQVVFCKIEVFAIVRDAIELDAIDGIALAARERRIVQAEVLGNRVRGADRPIHQFALALALYQAAAISKPLLLRPEAACANA